MARGSFQVCRERYPIKFLLAILFTLSDIESVPISYTSSTCVRDARMKPSPSESTILDKKSPISMLIIFTYIRGREILQRNPRKLSAPKSLTALGDDEGDSGGGLDAEDTEKGETECGGSDG